MDCTQTLNQTEAHCQRHGIRLTNKRKQVLSSLIGANKPLSAYELIEQCKSESGQTMPPMSIYRILDFLDGKHLVHKLNTTNKYVACTHIHCDHSHDAMQFLVCSQCQAVKEVNLGQPVVASLRQSVTKAGYTLTRSHIEIECVCNLCLSESTHI